MENYSKPLSIIIADDFPLLQIGLKTFLKSQFVINKIADAKNSVEVIEHLEKEPATYDIVLLDIFGGAINSFELTAILKKKYPKIKVIAFSMFADEYYIQNMHLNKANGFLLKTSSTDELTTGITEVMNGKSYFCKSINQDLINNSLPCGDYLKLKNLLIQENVHEIIFLLCMNKNNHEIAKIINLSERTIEKYRGKLNLLFGTSCITGLIKYGMRINISEDKLLINKFEKCFPKLPIAS